MLIQGFLLMEMNTDFTGLKVMSSLLLFFIIQEVIRSTKAFSYCIQMHYLIMNFYYLIFLLMLISKYVLRLIFITICFSHHILNAPCRPRLF